MVFSQTSQKTHSILKVVEIDRLKREKNQGNGPNGVIAGGVTDSLQQTHAPMASTSYSEDYLKPEPVFESTMCHDTDCEFFQDLDIWCSDLAKEERVQTIDLPNLTENKAYNTDTLHTPFSPHGWDGSDVNSPAAQASFYTTTPRDPLSPVEGIGFDTKFSFDLGLENDESQRGKPLDIDSWPVVMGELASEGVEAPWSWGSAAGAEYTKPNTIEHVRPFIDQEDSLEGLHYMQPVTLGEVERGPVVTEYIVAPPRPQRPALLLNVAAAPAWPVDAISTPEVLTYVEQLEAEKYPLAVVKPARSPPLQEETFISPDVTTAVPAPLDYEPITPKSESLVDSEEEKTPRGRRRRRSEDSDETYTPHQERTPPRKYKRRKPAIPRKDIIMALEDSQQQLPEKKRGRPPKRRESAISSTCSIDDNSSMSTQDNKYRESRDKNNEASKRSRMKRKLKELQMEQLADELEESNKRLKVKADILEEMTKKLKDALMKTILQK